MRALSFRNLGLVAALLLLELSVLATTDLPFDQASKVLPDRIGDFRAIGSSKRYQGPLFKTGATLTDFGALSAATRVYNANSGTYPSGGNEFAVYVVKTNSNAAAYALLTAWFNLHSGAAEDAAAKPKPPGGLAVKRGEIGTASVVADIDFFGGVAFVQGSTFVAVGENGSVETHSLKTTESLARQLSTSMERDPNEPPTLLNHLPSSETSKSHAGYAVSRGSLHETIGAEPVFEAINFDGGTEVVAANYGPSQLAIFEFTTPQLASDNDRRIIEKIQELHQARQAAPTAYRRVGNYAVFVFNAPDEQTANQLIDQVKYEQVVQWLGDNPYLFREAQKRYTETVLGTFVSVMKASGLAAVLCFGVGGFFGALLFSRRRAQRAQNGYSDAGAMMRLKLDEIGAEADTPRPPGLGKH